MARKRKNLKSYVVYVVAVVSQKIKADDEAGARDHAMKQVMDRLAVLDTNVYLPKVAVVEEGVDEEAKKHLEDAVVPWLEEGSGIKSGGGGNA